MGVEKVMNIRLILSCIPVCHLTLTLERSILISQDTIIFQTASI